MEGTLDGIQKIDGEFVIKRIRNIVMLSGCYVAGVFLVGFVFVAPYVVGGKR
tara:strand:+ start:795 stop:950 length:156 start_codon:yes stop_codon:yes gene_type:complete